MQTPRRSTTGGALASILQPLVDSGYLGADTVGELAQVSKEVNQATMEESVWSSFCQREHPNTSDLTDIVAAKGYRWLYKRWSAPMVKRRPAPIQLELPRVKLQTFAFLWVSSMAAVSFIP